MSSNSLNTILISELVADSYTPDLTLGPMPDIVDGIDLQVERADVLFQIARGDQSASAWLESREYLMRPGSRFVGNVSGIRFKNATPGAQAVVTAAVTGPDEPRLSPVIPLPATGIGDPLLQMIGLPPNGTILGPFDVGDWPSLLVAAAAQEAGQGIQLSPLYSLFAGAAVAPRSLTVLNGGGLGYTGGQANKGIAVVQNLAGQVSVQVNWQGGTGIPSGIFIAPCAFPQHQPFQSATITDAPEVLMRGTGNVAAGGQDTYLIPPFGGIAQLFATVGGAGPWQFNLQDLGFNNALGALLLQSLGPGVGADNYIEEIATVARPMLLTIKNTHATNDGGYTFSLARKES